MERRAGCVTAGWWRCRQLGGVWGGGGHWWVLLAGDWGIEVEALGWV